MIFGGKKSNSDLAEEDALRERSRYTPRFPHRAVTHGVFTGSRTNTTKATHQITYLSVGKVHFGSKANQSGICQPHSIGITANITSCDFITTVHECFMN